MSMPFRFPLLALACLTVTAFAAETTAPTWPLWDGHESIEQYAKRTNLPPTKTLDLGNGVNLELVLIPAGKFIMGTPEPESPWIGGTIAGVAGLIVLVLAARLLWRAFRENRRPQFSLRWLLVVVLIVGVAQFGAFRWWRTFHASRRYIPDASPAHEVTLTKPFYVAKYETTQEQYRQLMGVNPSQFSGANLPVECVSWDDAQAFCEKLSAKMAQTARLPTEAEWEFACRAGTQTLYCSGDDEADLARVGWHGTSMRWYGYETSRGTTNGTTHPVGQKEPNAWGVYDMHGNVWEWCQDWDGLYQPAAVVDPLQGLTGSDTHVWRGGAWYFAPLFCQSAWRFGNVPDLTSSILGFRVVVEVPKTP